MVETFQDDDGLPTGAAFPDQLYGFLAPLSAEEFVIAMTHPDEPV